MTEKLNDLTAIADGLKEFDHDKITSDNQAGSIRFEGKWNTKFRNFVESVEDDESIRWTTTRAKLDVKVDNIDYDNAIIIFTRKDDDELGIETQRLAEFVHDYVEHYDEIDDV